ncbi:MAG: glycosyltransferase [Thermodesulfobacteriota bacterium]
MSNSCSISSEKNVLCELSFPSVGPLPEGTARPFWSVMIPTYNPNETYLEETLNSVLEQYPGPKRMQIELIDDCSPEFDPKAFLENFGDDRISYYRQKNNNGIGGNWNTCIERARGHWIHILHQDDLLLPGFYKNLLKGITGEPGVGAVFCREFFIDDKGHTKYLQIPLRETSGILTSWLEHVFVGLFIRASAIIVKRSVYERLGGFTTSLQYALDWDMWKRIASSYPIWYEPEPLFCYREHRASASSEFINSGRNLVEIRKSIDISRSYLPEDISFNVSRKAKENYTKYGITVAVRMLVKQRDLNSALAQLRETQKLGSNTFFKSLASLTLDTILNALRDLKSKLV